MLVKVTAGHHCQGVGICMKWYRQRISQIGTGAYIYKNESCVISCDEKYEVYMYHPLRYSSKKVHYIADSYEWLTVPCNRSGFIPRRIQQNTFHMQNSLTMISQLCSSGGCQRNLEAHRADNCYFSNNTAVEKWVPFHIFPTMGETWGAMWCGLFCVSMILVNLNGVGELLPVVLLLLCYLLSFEIRMY